MIRPCPKCGSANRHPMRLNPVRIQCNTCGCQEISLFAYDALNPKKRNEFTMGSLMVGIGLGVAAMAPVITVLTLISHLR